MGLNPDKGKRFGHVSAIIDALGLNQLAIDKFLDAHIREEDKPKVLAEAMLDEREIVVLNNLARSNYVMSEEEKIGYVIDMISTEGMGTLVLGVRGSGKTCAVIYIAESLLRRGIRVYWYGFHPELRKAYPEIVQSFDWKDFKEGVVIVDEAAMLANAREAMTREAIARVKMFATVRHRGQSLIFISQNIFDVDISIARNSNIFWFKPTIIDDLFRRKKEIFMCRFFKYIIPTDSRTQKDRNAVFNRETLEMFEFNNPLPEKWNDNMSKPYQRIEDRGTAMDVFRQMVRDGVPQAVIKTVMEAYGWSLEQLSPKDDEEERPSATGKKPTKIIRCPHCNAMDCTPHQKRGPKTRYLCNNCGRTFTS